MVGIRENDKLRIYCPAAVNLIANRQYNVLHRLLDKLLQLKSNCCIHILPDHFSQLSGSIFRYALNSSRSSLVVSLMFLSEPAAK